MQYLDDDMDEVFRRAAEEYPLNTGSADWNEVVKKLSAVDPQKVTAVTSGKKNYKRLLLLLLLLPVIWMGYEYVHPNNYEGKNPMADKNIANNTVSPATPVSSATSSTTQVNKTRSANTNIQLPAVPAPARALAGNHQPLVSQSNTNNIGDRQNARIGPVQAIPQTDNIISDQVTTVEGVNKNEVTQVMPGNKNEVGKTITGSSTTAQQDNDKKENTIPPVTAKTKNQRPAKEHGMYAGLYYSPDISTVKFQSVKNTGHTIGIMIGYQFNKKLSVETGLAWNRKRYYSSGEYFNTKNIVLPAYAKITQLDGVCKMIEVPLTVRYNFKTSVKTNLSVSGGVSSYIMKKESYDYTIDHTGIQYPRSADYNNSSTNLMAVATIGFGYNRSLGKGAALHLEPYIKIPVTGIGIGKLPIMSTGMNIGITKKLSR